VKISGAFLFAFLPSPSYSLFSFVSSHSVISLLSCKERQQHTCRRAGPGKERQKQQWLAARATSTKPEQQLSSHTSKERQQRRLAARAGRGGRKQLAEELAEEAAARTTGSGGPKPDGWRSSSSLDLPHQAA
jgi:hypothetical protein